MSDVVGTTSTVEEFPPASLIALADPGLNEVTIVVPVNAGGHDFGLLAVTREVDALSANGRETHNQWAVLLPAAIGLPLRTPSRSARRRPGTTSSTISTPPLRAVGKLVKTPGVQGHAVVTFNDLMALGVLATASSAGVSVPGDLSLVGSDDVQAAAMS